MYKSGICDTKPAIFLKPRTLFWRKVRAL